MYKRGRTRRKVAKIRTGKKQAGRNKQEIKKGKQQEHERRKREKEEKR